MATKFSPGAAGAAQGLTAPPYRERGHEAERPYNLPAESIRNGWIESSLGLHLLAIGMVFEAIIVAAFGIAAFGMFVHVLLNPSLGKLRYCCYPIDIAEGVLGECSDPNAAIHLTPGVLECPSRSVQWVRLLYGSFYLLIVNRALVFVWDLPFQKKVLKMLPYVNDYDFIPRYQWQLAIFSIGAIAFGTHNYILKRKAIKILHRIFGFLAISFTLFFVYVAKPMDEAWGCYDMAPANQCNHGLCTDPNSGIRIQLRGKGSQPRHSPVFVWSIAFMATFYVLAFVVYILSIRDIKDVFHYRAIKVLGRPQYNTVVYE